MTAFDIPEPFCLLDQAQAVIVPVPYENTVSYGAGTRHGPAAILEASGQVELYDNYLEWEPYRAGITSVAPMPVANLPPEQAVEQIRRSVIEHRDKGRFVACLGGEHTISAGAAAAHLPLEKSAGALTVLSLDAHADLRYSYQGTIYSHACVMRRLKEAGFNVVLAGIRSLCREEAEYIEENDITVFTAEAIMRGRTRLNDIAAALTQDVYLSIDIDVFDSGLMPSVGTPEPGGLDWYRVTDILAAVTGAVNVVGMDLVELAPIPNLIGPDFLAAKLLYRTLGLILGNDRESR